MTDSYPDLISNSFSFKSLQIQCHLSPSSSSPKWRHPSSFRTPWSMPFLSWYVTKVTYETPLPPTPGHFITAVLGLMALQLGEINQAQNTLQSALRSAGAGCERREGTEPEQAYHWNRFLGDLDSFCLQALMIKRAFFFFTTAHPSSPRPPSPPPPPLHQLFSLWVSARTRLQNWFPRDATSCCCGLL